MAVFYSRLSIRIAIVNEQSFNKFLDANGNPIQDPGSGLWSGSPSKSSPLFFESRPRSNPLQKFYKKIGLKCLGPGTDPGILDLDTDPDPDRRQNLVDWSWAMLHPSEKFHENPFMTCWDALQSVSLRAICWWQRILENDLWSTKESGSPLKSNRFLSGPPSCCPQNFTKIRSCMTFYTYTESDDYIISSRR